MIFEPPTMMFVALLESSSMAVSRSFLCVPSLVRVVEMAGGLRATFGICLERQLVW